MAGSRLQTPDLAKKAAERHREENLVDNRDTVHLDRENRVNVDVCRRHGAVRVDLCSAKDRS